MPEWFDPSKTDQNGNPVFNSVPLVDTTLTDFSVAANYYTIRGNIDNPESSVFISKEPSADEYTRFARKTPSYFFIVHTGRQAKALISLEREGKEYNFFVVQPELGKRESVPVGYQFPQPDMPVLTQLRGIELAQIEDSTKFVSGKGEGDFVIFERQMYNLLPFSRVLDDVIALVRERKLHE